MNALLSDVHGNLEALQAVLDDIARHGVESVYCLGDLLGYRPNPRECVDLALRWKVVLMGHFDHTVLNVPPDLGPTAVSANRSLRWSQRMLDARVPDRQAAERRWAFLKGLAQRHEEGDLLFVHGSARNPLHEYVFPEDSHNVKKMSSIFASVSRHCFQGHTHVPGVFTEQAPGGPCSFVSPEEIDLVHRLDGRKTQCNVGSVGQPRDGNWRACYVLLDGNLIRFRRVEYDVERTIRKMRDIDDLDDFQGDRLGEGREGPPHAAWATIPWLDLNTFPRRRWTPVKKLLAFCLG